MTVTFYTFWSAVSIQAYVFSIFSFSKQTFFAQEPYEFLQTISNSKHNKNEK